MSTYGHSLVEVLTLKEASHLRHYCHPSRSRCGSRICEGRVVRLIDQRAKSRTREAILVPLLVLPRLAKPTTPGVCLPCVELEGLKDLHLEVDVAGHLRLAAMAYIYSVLPYLPIIATCSLVCPL